MVETHSREAKNSTNSSAYFRLICIVNVLRSDGSLVSESLFAVQQKNVGSAVKLSKLSKLNPTTLQTIPAAQQYRFWLLLSVRKLKPLNYLHPTDEKSSI